MPAPITPSALQREIAIEQRKNEHHPTSDGRVGHPLGRDRSLLEGMSARLQVMLEGLAHRA